MSREKELIQEAKERGYMAGTIVNYYGTLVGTDVLGDGEFCLYENKLIKYERRLEDDNPNFRRYDVIWSKECGWTKIETEPQGLHLK